MYYRGSARKLVANSISAMVAGIETYNKPRFAYRNEVVSILIVNAWELLFKAIISKSKESIYYKKQRNEPYRTLTLADASKRAIASHVWPPGISSISIRKNVDLLTLYRNQAVHFYNDEDFSLILYSLAQTSIINYRDVVIGTFGKDISDEMTWQILPLGVRMPVDPISYLSKPDEAKPRSQAANEFISELRDAESAVAESGGDSGRLLTIFSVSLQSVKKTSSADIVVGVDNIESADTVVIQRKVDPNISHPYRLADLLPKLQVDLCIRQYEFLAIVHVHQLRENPMYCWTDGRGALVKWSPEVVRYINNLSASHVQEACAKYAAASRSPARDKAKEE